MIISSWKRPASKDEGADAWCFAVRDARVDLKGHWPVTKYQCSPKRHSAQRYLLAFRFGHQFSYYTATFDDTKSF